MIQVRAPEAKDRDEWLRMRRALWPECPDEEHEAEIRSFLQPGQGLPPVAYGSSTREFAILVAQRPGGGLCGFVELSIRPYAEGAQAKPIGYIEGWYVDPDLRERGVGRALVHAAEEWGRSQGCRQMASDALLGNAISIQAHAAVGYQEVARLVHFKKDLG